MAKNRKRNRKSGKVSQAVGVETAVSTPKDSGNRLSKADQFRLEYAYVLTDLRTVFILAVVMFALLIGLNLLLQ